MSYLGIVGFYIEDVRFGLKIDGLKMFGLLLDIDLDCGSSFGPLV